MTLTTVLLAPVVAAMTTAGGAAGEQVSIPIWLEMLAVVVASVSGVLTAREHKLDFIGAIGLAVACGLGGGIIRDVILQKGAVYILDQPLALPMSVATAAIAFVFPVIFEKPDRLIAILDIFSVGLYAAVGADKSMVYELSPMVCVMMGFFTAVGGGMLRDVFLGQTPGIFQRGNFYAITAIAGATSYVALVENFHAPNILALVVCVAITMALRWISLHYNILTPTEVNLDRVARPIRQFGNKAVEAVSKTRSPGAVGARAGRAPRTRAGRHQAAPPRGAQAASCPKAPCFLGEAPLENPQALSSRHLACKPYGKSGAFGLDDRPAGPANPHLQA